MNILYITYTDPRSTNGGNEQRTNLLWNALKKYGKVHTIIQTEMEDVPARVDGEHPICFFNNGRTKKRWTPNGIFRRIMYRLCGLYYVPWASTNPQPYLNLYSNVGFDFIVVRYMYSLCEYHFWDVAPVWVDIDDHPTESYQTLVSRLTPVFLKPFGLWLNKRIVAKILSNVRGGWIANEQQVKMCGSKILYLPNIPLSPSAEYEKKAHRDNYLMTIGAMAYVPNHVGVDKFLKEVWPAFHKMHPEVIYLIGGRNAPKEYAARWNATDGVKYVGFIEDLEATYAHCLATVVPIYAGAGTCIKTLESMAFGRICLSTPFGVRGLSAVDKDGHNGLFVFNNSDEFMQAFEQSQKIDERDAIESNAQTFIDQHYSLESFRQAVDKVMALSTHTI